MIFKPKKNKKCDSQFIQNPTALVLGNKWWKVTGKFIECIIKLCFKKVSCLALISCFWNSGLNWKLMIVNIIICGCLTVAALSSLSQALAFGSFVLATLGKMSVALKQWIIKQSHLMIKDDRRQQAVTAGCDSETWLLLIHSELSLHVFRVNIPHAQSIRALMRSKNTAYFHKKKYFHTFYIKATFNSFHSSQKKCSSSFLLNLHNFHII